MNRQRTSRVVAALFADWKKKTADRLSCIVSLIRERACDRFPANQEKPVKTAYVTSKGQLVVPAAIRRRFNIKPGTRIVFIEENGRLIMQPVTPEYIHSFCGIFKLKLGEKSAVQELLEDRAADRAREDG
jgi:AbrB family looped-hinge helix DNA binding protein